MSFAAAVDGEGRQDPEGLCVPFETILEAAFRAWVSTSCSRIAHVVPVRLADDQVVECLLSGVTEGRVADIVGEASSGDGAWIDLLSRASDRVVELGDDAGAD